MLLVTVSAVFWSTAGLFVRMADVDAWTLLGWRSVFAATALGALAVVQARGQPLRGLLSIGLQGWLAVPIFIVSTISYVFALKLTTVANVMTIYATLPFIATGISFLWIGEKVTTRVLVASAISLCGIVIMAGAATRPQDIAGNLAAFLMTFGFGLQLVHSKRHPSMNMSAISAIACALCALLCWPLMSATIPSLYQLFVMALFGMLTTGLAYILVLTGSRYLSSGEASFLSMLDVVLGPLWVWMVFAEQPGIPVLIGGSLVLASVLWYLSAGLRAPAIAPAAS